VHPFPSFACIFLYSFGHSSPRRGLFSWGPPWRFSPTDAIGSPFSLDETVNPGAEFFLKTCLLRSAGPDRPKPSPPMRGAPPFPFYAPFFFILIRCFFLNEDKHSCLWRCGAPFLDPSVRGFFPPFPSGRLPPKNNPQFLSFSPLFLFCFLGANVFRDPQFPHLPFLSQALSPSLASYPATLQRRSRPPFTQHGVTRSDSLFCALFFPRHVPPA